MDNLYSSLAHDLGVPVSTLPSPSSTPTAHANQLHLHRTSSASSTLSTSSIGTIKYMHQASNPKPAPLRKLSLPPHIIHATIYDIEPSTPTSTSNPSTAPSTPRSISSQISLFSYTSATTLSSRSSDASLASSAAGSVSSTDSRHTLRRTASPRELSLRELRVKESDACLQRVYENQTDGFLDGPLFRPMVPPKSRLRGLVEVEE